MMARLVEAMRRLSPRCAADLTEKELTALWGEELTRYYLEKILRRGPAIRISMTDTVSAYDA